VQIHAEVDQKESVSLVASRENAKMNFIWMNLRPDKPGPW
jgi:hypothetical protein